MNKLSSYFFTTFYRHFRKAIDDKFMNISIFVYKGRIKSNHIFKFNERIFLILMMQFKVLIAEEKSGERLSGISGSLRIESIFLLVICTIILFDEWLGSLFHCMIYNFIIYTIHCWKYEQDNCQKYTQGFHLEIGACPFQYHWWSYWR